jgi:hypothetical protein
MNQFRPLITLVFLIIIMTSCDKDDDVMCNEEITPEGKSMQLEFKMNADEDSFMYGTGYEFNGVTVEFSELRFYLSDLTLHDDDENTELLKNAILLDAGSEENTFTMDETDFSHIHELHLLFGLNEIVNHEDPTQAEAPLNDASMHWGWNPESGYKFLKAEFSVDTDGDNIPDSNGSIHCATDAVAREFMLTTHQDVEEDHVNLEINVDVLAFFEGVDFLNLMGTHGGSPSTNSVADNVSTAFTIN